MGIVSSHRSPKLTDTNRCPSGSSATLPPAAAPHPLFLCRPGACTRGKCKTSTKPARTRRPTPTASPGNIAPTSSTTFSLSAAQNKRRVARGAAKRISVSLLPLEPITHSMKGDPKSARYCGLRIRLEIRLNVYDGAARTHCGQAIRQSDRSSRASRHWLFTCSWTRGITVDTEQRDGSDTPIYHGMSF